MPQSSQEVLKMLHREGWFVVRTKGSHVHLAHATRPGVVTVPHPRKDLPIGTLRSIAKQSGVNLR